ncbi:BEL1-like homeodomain protein 9 [Arachis stenosperma]|uniref:BEL1-like homeodomain protein 9 n=1 Tax=Arachis stenosperma TaxID=217475 RepID=UPI0025ABCF44|nr:BEL1-like homeodomain protein 9 [Arachis stenosperma]
MAEEGFEGYHVPQQSRRDKLRVVVAHNQQHHHQQTTTLLESSSTPPTTTTTTSTSWYDPSSFIPSDLLTCAAATQQGHHGNFHLNNEPSKPNNTTNLFASSSAVKQEEQQRSGLMMMGFGVVTAINNASSSSSSSPSSNSSSVSLSHHHAYMDPQSSSTLHLNNPSIHVFGNNNNNNNPLFLYQPQNLRDFDNHGGYGGGGGGSGGGGEIMVFKPEPLSLSLSSHNHNHGSNNNNHNSNNNGNNLPLELNLQRYGAMICGGGGGVIPGLVVNSSGGGSGTSNEVSRSCSSVMVVPQMMGPFTGYASVLKGSRFLKPAQQLLEELCDVGVGVVGAEDKIIVADASLMEPPPTAASTTTPLMECLNHSHHEDPLLLADQHAAAAVESRKKSRLLTMLDEVYRRYRQYYQQMHAVVTSFEYVSGLTNAAPYASLAIKTMSKHFRCLKNAITDQLQFNNKTHFQLSNRKDESPRFGNNDRGPYGQRSGFIDHQPVWRPQRGLPERAVTLLRAWLFEHFLHPYPTDTDKLMLAKQTGLSRSQVSNWFINARVRLWKPMVEEIHMLETRQAQKNTQREEHSRNKSSDPLPSDNTTLVSDNPSTSAADKFQEAPYKRAMNELPSMAIRTQEQVNLACHGNQQVGIGVSMGSASNNVSLTLGLHQNHGIGLAEPFPLSAAQRFGLGLETNNEGYVLSGFESQNRHFGRDVIGGQLLHDFVG